MKFEITAEVMNAAAAWLALLVAGRAYWLSKRNDDLLRADEELVTGPLQHPDLVSHDHRRAVIWTTLANKAHRRCVVQKVTAVDASGKAIPIDWAGEIDAVGGPLMPGGPLPVDNLARLFIRRTDPGGAFGPDTEVRIEHNFKNSPVILKFESDLLDQWVRDRHA